MSSRSGRYDWQDEAACQGLGTDLWYAKYPSAEAQLARNICRTECPVRAQCLTYALDQEEHWGIWGGLTEQERRRITRPLGAIHRG